MSLQDQLRNLLSHQRKDVNDIGLYGKLEFDDMKRLDRFIQGDPTSSMDCCLFLGKKKGTYCYFSFRGKKVSILRLMYHNFVGDLEPIHKIGHTCDNKGICCNLQHYYMENQIEEELSENKEISDSEQDSHADDDIFIFSDEVQPEFEIC